ncbi:MAG: alpha/beta fold hydrolase [Spirochaetales bacterium]|nr:alpha/beta fold hydrolase [Spirochaetales bacterium]
MYKSVELKVGEMLLRGVVRTPEGEGPFPTVIFYHGFSVDHIGMMRLHELFARRCVKEGFACVRFDFYGVGESDGDFEEMRYADEVEEAKAIYYWTEKQSFAKRDKIFLSGHSLGGAIASNVAPVVQPAGLILWAPGNTAYYDISNRTHAIPGHYEKVYDVGGLYVAGEFLKQIRQIDIVAEARGYKGNVLLVHGECDEKVPVASIGPYLDMYGDKAELYIVAGSNHQFSSVKWKTEVYDVTMRYLHKHLS